MLLSKNNYEKGTARFVKMSPDGEGVMRSVMMRRRHFLREADQRVHPNIKTQKNVHTVPSVLFIQKIFQVNKSASHEYQYVDEADFSLKKKRTRGRNAGCDWSYTVAVTGQ